MSLCPMFNDWSQAGTLFSRIMLPVHYLRPYRVPSLCYWKPIDFYLCIFPTKTLFLKMHGKYGYIPSYLIFRIIVWKWCVQSCILRKNGSQQSPTKAIFPQKEAPHTSLSHYNAKYQITRNSRILSVWPRTSWLFSRYFNWPTKTQ